jgi:large subunit ribosomal protein L21
MYAIIRSGSKQYRVKKGDVISVDLLEAEPGNAIEFREVLFVGETGGAVKVGAPTVAGWMVKGEMVSEVQGPKIQSVKYKKRKNQYRKFGHRQRYTQVKILDIVS